MRHENPYFLVASGDNFQDNNYPMENLSSTSPDTNNNNNNNTMTRDENESDEDEESHATPRTNSSGFSRLG